MNVRAEGNCYEEAVKFFLRLAETGKRPTLIHGEITFPSGRKINHAWVEVPAANRVYDPSANHPKTGKPPAVYELDWFYGNGRAKVVAHYRNPDLVLELIKKTGTWGPYQWMLEMERRLR
ncbi:MAG: hypothetical protein JRM83_06990 [Nitrososphaerota archaeon]|jgi:hypothetical protein|nr:hypothetical protein [Nitrososphaerota archaeon]